jgi:predicted nucleic acid-binding protein
MQHKRLVIDANILIRAVFGQRVPQLIFSHCSQLALYVAEANHDEAVHYLAQLAPARGLAEDIWRCALNNVMACIQLVSQDELELVEEQALARIGQRDKHDWPAVAAALLLDCPIWTEDADFFGTGIATWTTRTVDIYFNEPVFG